MTTKTCWTSKERVLTAVQPAQSDRVPMDFLGNPRVLERLPRELGTRTHRELLERLHRDVVDLRGVVDPENILAMSDAGVRLGRYL